MNAYQTISRRRHRSLVLFASVLLAPAAVADFDLNWNTFDGGGHMWTTGGSFELSGTIGQPDAGVMTGGNFELTGGFWAVAAGLPFAPGDLNCDGRVNNFDITPFVLALTATPPGYPQYYALYPDCDRNLGDINSDGRVDNFDITPFVHLLVGG
jgi:hypothetical protein